VDILENVPGTGNREQGKNMASHRVEVIDRLYAAILASQSPAERIAMTASAHRTARTMIRSRIEQLYPQATPEEKQREFLRRLLGHGTD
jgi:hypothetical protein